MKTDAHKNLYKKLLQYGGSATILGLAGVITYVLYQHDVQEQVFTNNYTTSVLFSDSLATSSGAAPWALLSLNWFACRAMMKRWLGYITKRFE